MTKARRVKFGNGLTVLHEILGEYSMMKKVIIGVILLIFVLCGLVLICTGGKKGDVFVNDYSVSEDGNIMTIKVGVASSMGYVRTVKEKQEDHKKYLTFYSTFGLNSTMGANNEFEIKLSPSITEIYFYRGDSGYELILQKEEGTNEWSYVK